MLNRKEEIFVITFEDVSIVLKQKSLTRLTDDYNNRQKNERIKNNECAKIILKQLMPTCLIPKNVDETDFLIQMIAFSVKNDSERKMLLEMILKQFNCNFSYELYFAIRLIDLFSTHDIDRSSLDFLWNSFFTIDKLNTNFEGFFLSLVSGERCEVKDSLRQLGIYASINERRAQCHKMTVTGLLHNPKLIGAYYSIPYQFNGSLEHSVLIDKEKSVVYDLAQDTSLPLHIWEKYYNKPTFLISGEEYQEIKSKNF